MEMVEVATAVGEKEEEVMGMEVEETVEEETAEEVKVVEEMVEEAKVGEGMVMAEEGMVGEAKAAVETATVEEETAEEVKVVAAGVATAG